jgi:hypothetical protein
VVEWLRKSSTERMGLKFKSPTCTTSERSSGMGVAKKFWEVVLWEVDPCFIAKCGQSVLHSNASFRLLILEISSVGELFSWRFITYASMVNSLKGDSLGGWNITYFKLPYSMVFFLLNLLVLVIHLNLLFPAYAFALSS